MTRRAKATRARAPRALPDGERGRRRTRAPPSFPCPASPAASLISVPSSAGIDEGVAEPAVGASSLSEVVFAEFFAGSARLSAAMADAGLETRRPDEHSAGGTDFRDPTQVQEAFEALEELASSGKALVVHLAPPCATFSRARDRSWSTRLRSRWYPQGLPGRTWAVTEANAIAAAAYEFAERAASELHALVTMENPRTSYLWAYVSRKESLPYVDVHLAQCRFGGSSLKPTTIRCWNWVPASLAKTCVLTGGGTFTCGRTKEDPHPNLEFGGASTAAAAVYPLGAL